MNNVLHKIRVNLYENFLTENPNDYSAKVIAEPFNPQKHNILFQFKQGEILRKETPNMEVEVMGMGESGIIISQVTDTKTGSVNDRITPGKNLKIKGSRLKLAGNDPQVVTRLRRAVLSVWLCAVYSSLRLLPIQVAHLRRAMCPVTPLTFLRSYALTLLYSTPLIPRQRGRHPSLVTRNL
jgi:hypothetical protein